MYKLNLGLLGPTLSFIYKKLNLNSIFIVISFSVKLNKAKLTSNNVGDSVFII